MATQSIPGLVYASALTPIPGYHSEMYHSMYSLKYCPCLRLE